MTFKRDFNQYYELLMSLNREGKIHVSNLPNTTPKEHIVEYLATAGPIK
jgi:hypothetical protein